MLQNFFESYRFHRDWDRALAYMDSQNAFAVGVAVTKPDFQDELKRINRLQALVIGFLEFNKHQISEWNIVGVEQEYRLPMKDFIYAFTVDLVVHTGFAYEPIDWKFTQDFYSRTMVDLLPQVPKYIGAMRKLDMNTRRGHYGFLRYRVNLKDQNPRNLYKIQPIDPNRERINTTFEEFMRVAEKIKRLKEMDGPEWLSNVERTSNKLVCNSCGFNRLCAVELSGSDGKLMREELYAVSTYGYAADE